MYSPMIYLLADVFIINTFFQKQLGSGFSPQVASIFKIFNCSVNWLNIKMHSYNFCQYIVKMLVFTKFKETLKKKIRNGMKLTTSEINHDTFPCNITKGTLNWFFIIASHKMTELWKLLYEGYFLINQLLIKKCVLNYTLLYMKLLES